MKKIISFVGIITIMLSLSMTALAGSIPEDLLHSDDAQIFFAEVVAYHPDKENPDIEFSPVKKVKGDVKTGTKQIAYNINTIGNFDIKVGNVYLFTYFDENNPTDIFEVTSYDTSTLKLKNTDGDMWERFEKYLNEGRYEDAEHERIDRMNNELVINNGETKTLSELLGEYNDIAGDITFHYADGPDMKAKQVDRKDFFKTADDIVCTEIESTDHINRNGFYIVADIDKAVYISDDGKVGENHPSLSFVAQAKYKISSADLVKLQSFIDGEAEKLPPLETPLAKHIGYDFLIGVVCGACIGGVIGYIIKRKRKTK